VIVITRLDGTTVLVNVDQIESIEQTPDTIVSLANGHKIIVRETPDELVSRIVQFKQRLEHAEPSGAAADKVEAPAERRG
jgi:flagellar protein FlbD